jgi:hypothetical protein
MKTKDNIASLQELIDWIDNNTNCAVFDIEDDNFTVSAPNNAPWQIIFDKDDDVNEIISKAIEQLEEFDADERFTEWWSADFAKHNGFTPRQFIDMLKEDEEIFRELARELEELES